MHGNTLIIDAFWVSNKKNFPTILSPNIGDGRAFYDYYSGEARYLGWMDLVLLKDIVKKHSINHIILQNLDTLGKIAQVTINVQVCVHYLYNRFVIRTPVREKKLINCKPIYTTVEFGGWEYSEDDDQIPIRAQSYMRYLLIHTRVDSITTMTNKIKFTAYFDSKGSICYKTEPNL